MKAKLDKVASRRARSSSSALAEIKESLFRLNFKKALGDTDTVKHIRTERKELARLQHVLRARAARRREVRSEWKRIWKRQRNRRSDDDRRADNAGVTDRGTRRTCADSPTSPDTGRGKRAEKIGIVTSDKMTEDGRRARRPAGQAPGLQALRAPPVEVHGPQRDRGRLDRRSGADRRDAAALGAQALARGRGVAKGE